MHRASPAYAGIFPLEGAASDRNIGRKMATIDAQLAVLKHARDAANGVTYLSRDVGLGADYLDAMLQEREPIPEWVFLRLMDYLIRVGRQPRIAQRADPEVPDGMASGPRVLLP